MQQHYLSFQRKNQYAALSNKCLLYGGAGIVVFLSNHIIVPTSRGRLLSFSRPRVSLHDIINERESHYSRDGIMYFQSSSSWTIILITEYQKWEFISSVGKYSQSCIKWLGIPVEFSSRSQTFYARLSQKDTFHITSVLSFEKLMMKPTRPAYRRKSALLFVQ